MYPVPQTINNQLCQQTIINKIVNSNVIESIEDHYKGFTFKGSTKFEFTRLEAGCPGIAPHGENCTFLNGKWAQVKPFDLTCYIALNDTNSKVPFDEQFEVYGGKYQFINHAFGFMPERGTLIVHPSSPHFVNAHNEVRHGTLTFVKFHLVSDNPVLYQPSDYPGDYTTWFKGLQ